jgi:hypothetical protein
MSDTDTIFAHKQTIAKLRHKMDELQKDKERLDWLLKTQSYLSINRIGTRKDIDKEMKSDL